MAAASDNSSRKCQFSSSQDTCKKIGMIKCDGCSSRYCKDHFSAHRRLIDEQFDRLCSDRDLLYQEIYNSNASPSTPTHPSLEEVNQWEHSTIQLVQRTAENARQRVLELLYENKIKVKQEYEQFSNELRQRKDNDDYFEPDIEMLSQKLEQLKIDVTCEINKKTIQVKVHPIHWPRVLNVHNSIEMNNCKVNNKEISNVEKLPQRQAIAKNRKVNYFVGGSLLSHEDQMKLNEFYDNRDQQWQLIYKATRDGFDASTFHRLCDGKGPTMTIILSTDNYLFGGYVSVSWRSVNRWETDTSAFIYTLNNPHRIPPTKYKIKDGGRRAIWSNSSYGPTFGYFDLIVEADSYRTLKNPHYSQFPADYVDTTGKANLTFTETEKFSAADIEVYALAR
ncbi:unnamed protein product [Didymodactylos carnosus]|uniref:TLDc domain-containing protein n=1 Tax=Didymodactylos carnosus TaxID=1234261 RepID=A0A815YZE6_9BILA|nr:unnamed protein product [Didymodactylos carnosus]CAF4442416.1 unnamed protein product [Didymodactylos carnosus]